MVEMKVIRDLVTVIMNNPTDEEKSQVATQAGDLFDSDNKALNFILDILSDEERETLMSLLADELLDLIKSEDSRLSPFGYS